MTSRDLERSKPWPRYIWACVFGPTAVHGLCCADWWRHRVFRHQLPPVCWRYSTLRWTGRFQHNCSTEPPVQLHARSSTVVPRQRIAAKRRQIWGCCDRHCRPAQVRRRHESRERRRNLAATVTWTEVTRCYTGRSSAVRQPRQSRHESVYVPHAFSAPHTAHAVHRTCRNDRVQHRWVASRLL